MKRFLDWLDKRGSARMIYRNGKPYLKRHYLIESETIFGSLYIHTFHASDPDDLHSHPWPNVTFVLGGAYIEHYLDLTSFVRKSWNFVFRPLQIFHRIEVLDETKPPITLFWRGKRITPKEGKAGWGFMTKDGFVDANDYKEREVKTRGRDYTTKGIFFPKVIEKERNEKVSS